MSFSGPAAKLCFILRIDLPTHNIRLSEGGEVIYDGDKYAPEDSIFGTVVEVENVSSGAADEAPLMRITWRPKDRAAAVALLQPSSQKAFVEQRVLSIDRATNAVLTDHRIFTGMFDTGELITDTNLYEIPMGITTDIDRLLNTDKGNKLSRAFHRKMFPTETGLDFMTGTTTPVPWGDNTAQSRGNASGGAGGGGSLFGGIKFV